MLAQTLMALLLSFSWSILLEQLTQLQLLQNSPFAKQSQYLTESDTEHRKHELWYLLGQFSVVHINKYSIINCSRFNLSVLEDVVYLPKAEPPNQRAVL